MGSSCPRLEWLTSCCVAVRIGQSILDFHCLPVDAKEKDFSHIGKVLEIECIQLKYLLQEASLNFQGSAAGSFLKNKIYY